MGDKFKKKVKAIKNPNTKFYFLVYKAVVVWSTKASQIVAIP